MDFFFFFFVPKKWIFLFGSFLLLLLLLENKSNSSDYHFQWTTDTKHWIRWIRHTLIRIGWLFIFFLSLSLSLNFTMILSRLFFFQFCLLLPFHQKKEQSHRIRLSSFIIQQQQQQLSFFRSLSLSFSIVVCWMAWKGVSSLWILHCSWFIIIICDENGNIRMNFVACFYLIVDAHRHKRKHLWWFSLHSWLFSSFFLFHHKNSLIFCCIVVVVDVMVDHFFFVYYATAICFFLLKLSAPFPFPLIFFSFE